MCTPCTTPMRLTPIVHSHTASGASTMPPPPTPALLHTTWTAPNAESARSRTASTSAATATSATTPTAATPAASSSATVAASGASSTSASASRMPSEANRRARARPIPLAPPVTTATRSCSSRIEPPRRMPSLRALVACPRCMSSCVPSRALCVPLAVPGVSHNRPIPTLRET